MSQNRTQLKHIESIRAFAALSVAIFHFTNAWNEGNFLIPNADQRFFFTYGAQGVEIFYVISGFIIPYALYHSTYSTQNYFKYLGKRLVRLMPPYLLTIAAILLFDIFTAKFLWGLPINIEWRNVFANSIFAVDFIHSMDFLHNYFPDNRWINPVFETLKVEVQFYVFIGLVFPLINRNRFFLLPIGIFLLLAGIYTAHMNTLLVNSPYFLLGIGAFYIFKDGWKPLPAILILCSIVSLLIFYVRQDLIAGILAFVLILWLPSNFKFLNFTGKISYSYYLIHGLSGGQLIYFMRDTSLAQNSPYLLVLFALVISWLASFLIYFCIEKPSMKISKRIRYSTKR
ncbi:acyltransferase family protein [Crocinitomix algicola]|uniref:acyltransferase family protein n=1 Tax=Crocinitomix algicola TaxID=1740263 RepID=UPI000832F0C1|nr:acyltransferase [Crocinitomix algicola]